MRFKKKKLYIEENGVKEIIVKLKKDIKELDKIINKEIKNTENNFKISKQFKDIKTSNKEKKVKIKDNNKKEHTNIKKEAKALKSFILKKKQNKNKIYLPSLIKESPKYIETEDTYIKEYFLADIPEYTFPTLLFNVINSGIPITISYHLTGVYSKSMIKASKVRLSVLEGFKNERRQKGKIQSFEIEKEKKELEELIQNLIHGSENMFLISFYIQITGKDKNQLKKQNQILKDIFEKNNIVCNLGVYKQKDILKSILPFNKDYAYKKHLVQTTTAKNLLPFLSRNLMDEKGIFIGTNFYNNSIAIIDFFKTRNANINIFGTSGSGKSVTSKLLIARLLLLNIQSIIIDPEGEYTKLTKNLKGEVIKFDINNGFNPFYFKNIQNKEKLHNHINNLKIFLKFFINKDIYNSSTLDNLLIKLYDLEKEKHTFINFYNICLKDSEGKKYIKDLNVLKRGSLKGIFTNSKKINLDENIITFDLSTIKSDSLKIPLMFLISTLINNILDTNSTNNKKIRKKMIFIDEAHKLLVNKDTTNFYIDLVKTARKRNAGVCSITQNPEDFIEQNRSKTIITQAESTFLLKQSQASIKYIKDKNLFGLENQILKQLPFLNIGECLYIRENENIKLEIYPFEKEQEIIFT